MLSCEFCEIFWNIYFANVYEGLPLKNKIFARVSFCKILGFYYKRNTQIFYYEGTWSCNPLKIIERVNMIIFQNSWVIASVYTPADKNMFKVDSKGMFQECYSGDFIISLKIFLKSVTESNFHKSSGLYTYNSEGLCNGACF